MASPPRSARQHRRAKREGRRKAVIGAVAAVVLVTALVGGYIALAGGSDSDSPKVTNKVAATGETPETVEGPQISVPPPGHSYIATVKDELPEIQVFEDQDAPLPAYTYPNPWLLNNDPNAKIKQTFLAERVSKDGKWLHVFLPERPNGLTGWVRTDDVVVTENPYSIGVDLSKREITVREGTKVIYNGKVAIGSDETPLSDAGGQLTPTPRGIYYIRVLLKTDDPSSVYGPFAYGLSAHSETLTEFNGGDAEVGIHGNNDPSVLGKNITHGCIRMDNEEITKLSEILPLGTPVVIS